MPAVHALVVDDSPTQLLDLRLRLVQAGFEVTTAESSDEALDLVDQRLPDIVLTDLLMPGSDGLDLVRKLHAKNPGLPVVVLTAHGSEEVAALALKNGAAGYIPKRYLDRDLAGTMESVVQVARTHRVRRDAMSSLTHIQTYLVIDNDPALIPPLVKRLQGYLAEMGLCEENARLRVAMALREALLNAVEHGNLEVSSALRENPDDSYHRMTEMRRRIAPYSERRVHIHFSQTQQEARYVIRDEGPGFDPSKLPDPTDPENLEKASGRGLLLMRSFMDDVYFNETGNQITLVKRRDQP